MFKFANLKLFRKFLILTVLSAGLFLVSFNKATARMVDCEDCLPRLEACLHDNCDPLTDPQAHAGCVHICEVGYNICVDFNCP